MAIAAILAVTLLPASPAAALRQTNLRNNAGLEDQVRQALQPASEERLAYRFAQARDVGYAPRGPALRRLVKYEGGRVVRVEVTAPSEGGADGRFDIVGGEWEARAGWPTPQKAAPRLVTVDVNVPTHRLAAVIDGAAYVYGVWSDGTEAQWRRIEGVGSASHALLDDFGGVWVASAEPEGYLVRVVEWDGVQQRAWPLFPSERALDLLAVRVVDGAAYLALASPVVEGQGWQLELGVWRAGSDRPQRIDLKALLGRWPTAVDIDFGGRWIAVVESDSTAPRQRLRFIHRDGHELPPRSTFEGIRVAFEPDGTVALLREDHETGTLKVEIGEPVTTWADLLAEFKAAGGDNARLADAGPLADALVQHGGIGNVAALEELAQAWGAQQRWTLLDDARLKQLQAFLPVLQEAVRRLKAGHAPARTLPIPASAPAPDTKTLPRPASAPTFDAATLPRPAGEGPVAGGTADAEAGLEAAPSTTAVDPRAVHDAWRAAWVDHRPIRELEHVNPGQTLRHAAARQSADSSPPRQAGAEEAGVGWTEAAVEQAEKIFERIGGDPEAAALFVKALKGAQDLTLSHPGDRSSQLTLPPLTFNDIAWRGVERPGRSPFIVHIPLRFGARAAGADVDAIHQVWLRVELPPSEGIRDRDQVKISPFVAGGESLAWSPLQEAVNGAIRRLFGWIVSHGGGTLDLREDNAPLAVAWRGYTVSVMLTFDAQRRPLVVIQAYRDDLKALSPEEQAEFQRYAFAIEADGERADRWLELVAPENRVMRATCKLSQRPSSLRVTGGYRDSWELVPVRTPTGLEDQVRRIVVEAWRELGVIATPPYADARGEVVPIFDGRPTFSMIPPAALSGLRVVVLAASGLEEEGVRALLEELGVPPERYAIWRGLTLEEATRRVQDLFLGSRPLPVTPSATWVRDLLAGLEEAGVIPLGDLQPARRATEAYFQGLA